MDPEILELGIPILGICYGHQILAHALGGRVGPNPRGREIGTIGIDLASSAATTRSARLVGALSFLTATI